MSETLLYTPKCAARILRVSERTLRRWELDGKVRAWTCDGVKRFTRKELERFVNGEPEQPKRQTSAPVESRQ